MRSLLRRCLERNPRNRLHDIADARIVLEDLVAGKTEEGAVSGVGASGGSSASAASRRLPWVIALAASAAAIALAIVLLRAPRAEPQRTMRFQVDQPESSAPTRRGTFFELSPDGRFLLMASGGELWVRSLDAVAAKRLEGIVDATYPFWSPDGAWIGFFAENQLKRVARDGGVAQKICDALDARGGAWGADGLIVFADQQGIQGLKRVPSQGGVPTAITRMAAEGVNQYHRYPQFLPDGRRFLYQYLVPAPELAGVYLGTVDGAPPERVLEGGDQALFAPDVGGSGGGYLLFRRETVLMAQRFDPDRRRTDGDPIPVADDVGTAANTGAGAFSVSSTGALAFRREVRRSGAIGWVDRAGKPVETVVSETQEINGIALARGGRRVAFGQGRPPDIWTVALPGGAPSRFTFGPAPGWSYPIWSPDGIELAYTTFDLVGLPRYELRRRRADRAGSEETLVNAPTTLYAWDWSPDGGSLLYGDDAADLWLLPLAGDRKPVPFRVAPGKQALGQFSPDGRLVAYTSDEQGQFEVFVGTLPPSGALWQISTGGGNMPRWRRDGRELFYRAADGKLMSIALGAGGGSSAIEERSAPRPLFAGIPSSGNTQIFTYSPADDGQSFLVASTRADDWQRITLVLNWQSELAQRASPDR
jgi:Tol biopolymer transport system component